MSNKPPLEIVNTDLPDIIELKGIVQKYGDKTVLDGFNLLIEDFPDHGQFVVVLGKSGCGKSTFLRYLSKLSTPTSGEVLVNGESIKNPIPMVFQRYSNLPWLTVLENVMLPLELRGVPRKEQKERAMEIAKLVGLEEHVGKFAQDKILSGGQMQRVAIARSLVADPRVLLMDEPYGALDTYTRFKMQMLLAKIWEQLKATVVFVTHDISEAVFLGHEIYVMDADPGRIVKKFNVDLPAHRDRATKRDPKFINLVNEIDDMLFELSEQK